MGPVLRVLPLLEEGLRRLNRFVASATAGIVSTFLALMVAAISLQVFCRFVLNNPLSWAEELTIFLFIWMTFLGTVAVARKGQWIHIDVLIPLLPEKFREHLTVITNTASIIFCFILVKEGLKLTYLQKDMLTSALEISWAWISISIPLSSFMLALQILEETVRKLKQNPSALLSLASTAIPVFILTMILPPLRSFINYPLFLFVAMLSLFLLGIPVGIALGLTSTVFILAKGDLLFLIIPQSMAAGVNSFPFMAVPFFILAGDLMLKGGLTRKLIEFANALVAHIRGGLGHVTVVANLIMAGMSGSEVADAAATGAILIPSMKEKGYPPGFAAGITAAAAVIGPIVPPSVPFVIYGALADTSVLKLFLAGAIPGCIMALFLMVAVYILAVKREYRREKRTDFRSLLLISRSSLWVLFMPVIIVGGMLAGVFTPTEASDIAVIYAIVLGVFVYRELKGRKLLQSLSEVAVMTSGIMYIVATASVIGWIAAREQIPQVLMVLHSVFGDRPWMVLTIINIILLFLGSFISTIPLTLIMVPILIPVIQALHIDPIQFGVIFTLNLMIGLNTPPFGMTMFVVCKIAGISIVGFSRHWWPFFLALLLILVLVTYVPGLVLWLPSLLVK